MLILISFSQLGIWKKKIFSRTIFFQYLKLKSKKYLDEVDLRIYWRLCKENQTHLNPCWFIFTYSSLSSYKAFMHWKYVCLIIVVFIHIKNVKPYLFSDSSETNRRFLLLKSEWPTFSSFYFLMCHWMFYISHNSENSNYIIYRGLFSKSSDIL